MQHTLFKKDQYESVETWNGERVYIHRLLAVAKYGFDEVCDKDVHHKSYVGYDNRYKNIELLSRENHVGQHSSDSDVDSVWRDYDFITQLINKGHSIEYLSDYFDCTKKEIEHYHEYDSAKPIEEMIEEMEYPYRNPDVLIHLYFNKNMLQTEMADKFGCTHPPISRNMTKHNLHGRTSPTNKEKPWRDKELLKEEYVIKGRSMTSIANEMDCSRATISNWIDRHELEKRPAPQEMT